MRLGFYSRYEFSGYPEFGACWITKQVSASQTQLPAAIRTDLGAIFVFLELSRKTWLITSLPRGGEKISKHSVPLDNLAAFAAMAGWVAWVKAHDCCYNIAPRTCEKTLALTCLEVGDIVNWSQAGQRQAGTTAGLIAAAQSATGLQLIATSHGPCLEDVSFCARQAEKLETRFAGGRALQ